jgi:hypothetical protein
LPETLLATAEKLFAASSEYTPPPEGAASVAVLPVMVALLATSMPSTIAPFSRYAPPPFVAVLSERVAEPCSRSE